MWSLVRNGRADGVAAPVLFADTATGSENIGMIIRMALMVLT